MNPEEPLASGTESQLNPRLMFPTNQRIEHAQHMHIQQMRRPQNRRTYQEDDRYREEYERQSIPNRDSGSPEYRRDAEYQRRISAQRRIPAPEEPQHWGYQHPHQNRRDHQQSRFEYPRKYDKFQQRHHPYHWHDSPPPWTQDKPKSRENTKHRRYLDTDPRQDRCEPREKQNSNPRSNIHSESPSTVTDQAPSQPADQEASENAVEPVTENDEDGSQSTSLDQNATSQTVLPPPKEAPPSSTQVSSQPPVDDAAKSLPEKSSTIPQNGIGSKNQSSVQIVSNHKTASSSSSKPASSTSTQPPVRSVTESSANKREHPPKNSIVESTNVKKDRETKIATIVKKFPYLYDQAEPLYRDKIQTEKAWAAISKELNEPVRDCKNKWHSQRTKYRRIRKETDGQNFGKYAKFMAAMSFLPHKNHIPKNKALGENATKDQAQTEQAVSKNFPDTDEQFAKALVGELQQFPPKIRTSVKADMYQVLAKWAKFTLDQND